MLPYVPASTRQVDNVMKALVQSNIKGKSLIDLGSGDGRIVIKYSTNKSYDVHVNFKKTISGFSSW